MSWRRTVLPVMTTRVVWGLIPAWRRRPQGRPPREAGSLADALLPRGPGDGLATDARGLGEGGLFIGSHGLRCRLRGGVDLGEACLGSGQLHSELGFAIQRLAQGDRGAAPRALRSLWGSA